MRISVVLPAYNEADEVVAKAISGILAIDFGCEPEIIVVDDGSPRPIQAPNVPGVRVIRHPYNMGNGAAIKTGARQAHGDTIVFMDADGQHDPADIPRLLKQLDEGYDMVVGARSAASHASSGRLVANYVYSRLASFMTGYRVDDLTSGFRAVRAAKFRRFLYLLPNGFSYPTTSTMAFFRSAYPVAYIPIKAEKREGKSKIRWLRDGVRFFLIILKIGALFSPMRLFLPISGILFVLGLVHYLYTYIAFERFTNMSALLFIASMLTFLIGILSEQVSSLHYKGADEPSQDSPSGRDRGA